MKASGPRKVNNKSGSSSFFRKRNSSGFFRRNSCFFNRIQTKMDNATEDKQEKEGDALSEKAVQRKEATEKEKEEKIQKKDAKMEDDKLQKKEEDKDKLQKKEEEKDKLHAKADGPVTAPNHVETSIHNTKGKGAQLPSSVSGQMESAFGTDFSKVRIHTDNTAAELNKELNSQALNHGKDIYFNSNK